MFVLALAAEYHEQREAAQEGGRAQAVQEGQLGGEEDFGVLCSLAHRVMYGVIIAASEKPFTSFHVPL